MHFFNLPNLLLEYYVSDFVFMSYGLGCLCVLCFFHFFKNSGLFVLLVYFLKKKKEREEEGVGLGKEEVRRIWEGELWPKFNAWIFN